jgi:hypothetical protein
VLHDEHGVALVPQRAQQAREPVHVARVQAHAGLVEDVRHAGQARAEVADGLEPLRLPAGDRGGLPVQAEVAEADPVDPPQAGERRLGDRRGDGVVDALELGDQVTDLQRAVLGDVASADP